MSRPNFAAACVSNCERAQCAEPVIGCAFARPVGYCALRAPFFATGPSRSEFRPTRKVATLRLKFGFIQETPFNQGGDQ